MKILIRKPFLFFIFLLTTISLINFSSCEDPISPYDQLKPGRRDYTWEVDTLNIPFTILHKIWGSSPTDVWAIGPGGDLDKTIYHYDGEKWNNDGISRKISPISIWGFASDDVWLGGNEGRIWHYNGSDWSENFHIEDPRFVYSGFQDIWGESNKNIWAVGYLDSAGTRKGLVYHYDGNDWSRVNIDYKHGNLLRIRRGQKTNNNYYLWGLWEDDFIGDSTKLLEYNGSKYLKELSKSRYGNGKGHFVQEIDDEIIFTINNGLYTYKNSKFELFVTNSFPNSYKGIVGRNKKDIFWSMPDGLTHYNGSDIEYILNINDSQRLTRGVLFKDYVFFLAVDLNNGLSLIHRGKLEQ
ncbi:MAG: hypothetical protein GY936_05960 [Ignavibacteriae bacterium]|nr:hypothetical protein [Ignavibacteriota bacterium]